MSSVLNDLGLSRPVVAAPMAGGPSTVELVASAASAGGVGFLAAGYRSVEQLGRQISEVRSRAMRFGVNLFAPNPIDIGIDAYRSYAELIQPLAERYQLVLPESPLSDDDAFAEKVALLIEDPVPIVSFTFGIPERPVIRALQEQGTLVVQSVTNIGEARAATGMDVDVLAVQGHGAGGHSATLTPERLPAVIPLAELVAMIRADTGRPILAGGGIADSGQARAIMQAGADAVVIGTALLRCPEAGTSATHRAALAALRSRETVLTRAFTGRPARGIRNAFIDRFDAVAAAGYPAIHHLTSGLRKAAAAAGDVETLHLWAGTGFARASDRPVRDVLEEMTSLL